MQNPLRRHSEPSADLDDLLADIQTWEAKPPSIGIRARLGPIKFGNASSRISRVARDLIPAGAIENALRYADAVAVKTADRDALLRRADVASVPELRNCAIEDCDALAAHVRNRAMVMAAGTGMTTGAGGAALLAVDIPALLTLCLRTIHRTAVAYGYNLDGPGGHQLAIGLFALASSNSLEEKQRAIAALSVIDPANPAALAAPDLSQSAWREGIERATEREVAKQAVTYSMVNLARQLGVNLAQRKAAAAVPVIGAVAGGSVNAWTVYDLCKNMQQAFRAWRLGHWGAGIDIRGTPGQTRLDHVE